MKAFLIDFDGSIALQVRRGICFFDLGLNCPINLHFNLSSFILFVSNCNQNGCITITHLKRNNQLMFTNYAQSH